MRVKEALKQASLTLNPKEARILLSHHLKCDRLELLMRDDENISDIDGYFELIKRAKESEPIEYITNSVSFYSKEFHIKKGSLIPRPETEILIDKVLEIATNFSDLKIAEIGVGSGVISIILALNLPSSTITATDISQNSLDLAKLNAKKFGVLENINFVKTSLLDGIEQDFDIIVSNPPYIANGAKLEANLSYEPDIALFGGEIGDELLKQIIDLWVRSKAKYLCCEMGYDQKEPLKSYLLDLGISEVEFYQDLAGHDRGFVAKSRS
jgi:release factor glutamine methyltransferase